MAIITLLIILISFLCLLIYLYKRKSIYNKKDQIKPNIKAVEKPPEATDINLNCSIEVEICFKPNQEFLEAEIHK